MTLSRSLTSSLTSAGLTRPAGLVRSSAAVSYAALSAAIALAANGALYDPSDLTSLYQSRTGGSTGASGAVVGIMLDKSYMGGSSAAAYIAGQAELVTNGNFATDTGWTKGTGWTIAGGVAVATALAASNFLEPTVALSVTTGRWYRITITIVSNAGGGVGVSIGATDGDILNALGTYTQVLRAGSTENLRIKRRGSDFTGTIDNVSVKEIPGYHALAPSDAARPLLGTVPSSGLRNLLTYSEQFDNAAWTKSNVTATANQAVAPDGTTTADKIESTNTVSVSLNQSAVVAATSATASVYAKKGTGATRANYFRLRNSTTATSLVEVTIDYDTGAITYLTGASGAVVTLLANGWVRVSLSASSGITSGDTMRFDAFVSAATATTGEFAYGWGAQLETGSTATAYQKVITANEVTEAGVTTCYFLVADGVDDWMNVTPTLNLGEAWWHVGGWRSDTDTDCPFAISHQQQRALSAGTGTKWSWYISAGGTDDLAIGNIRTAHILTVQQASLSSIVGRYNGTSSAAIDPYDGSSPTNGLALFTGNNSSFSLGLAGRFYGGAFAPGSLSTTDRAILELWAAQQSGTTASLLAANPSALAEAAAALGGIEPYHYWDFILDRFLFAQTTTPSRALSTTPGWSFTRASTGYAETVAGTLTAFASGELRRTDRGVLIEGARTNLCLRSQAWGTSPWGELLGGSGATVTENAAVAPDGTSTATRIAFLSQFGGPKQDISTTNAVTYTWSFWAKRESGNTALHLYHNDSATSATTAFTVTNQWARYSVAVLGKSGSGNVTFGIQDRNASGQGSILVWGAQLEAASFPSSQIPTTTASATRAADTLVVTGISGIAPPFTMLAEIERGVDTGGSEAFFAANTAGGVLQELYVNSSDQAAAYGDPSGLSAVTGAVAVGSTTRIAGRFAQNDLISARGGTLGTLDSATGTLGTPDRFRFGTDASVPSFGYLRRAAIFNSALSDANLQTVTSS